MDDRIDELIRGVKETPSDEGHLVTPAGDPELKYVSKTSRVTYKWMHDSYIRRQQQANEAIAREETNPRVVAWKKFTKLLKESSLDEEAKIQAAHLWVNEAIHYHWSKKWGRPKDALQDLDWHQDIHKTLTSGQGMCGDISYLTYETLKAAGISEDKMRLVSGQIADKNGETGAHQILVVNVNGKNLVLNNNLTDDGWRLSQSGGVEPAEKFFHGADGGSKYSDGTRFKPLAAYSRDKTYLYPMLGKDGRDINPPPVSSQHSPNIQIKEKAAPAADSADIMYFCTDDKSCFDVKKDGPGLMDIGKFDKALDVRDAIKDAHRINVMRLGWEDWRKTNSVKPVEKESDKAETAPVEASTLRGTLADTPLPAAKAESVSSKTSEPLQKGGRKTDKHKQNPLPKKHRNYSPEFLA